MGEKWGLLPRGVSIKKNRISERIQVSFTYIGIRCREILKIPVTRRNIKYAGNLLGEILNSIERKTFIYSEYFPESSKLKVFGQQVNKGKTVYEYLDEFQQSAIKRGLSPSTIEGYRKIKNQLVDLHSIPVVELTPARLKDYFRQSRNAPKTLRNKLSYLRSALAEALTDGLVDHNPADAIKLSNYVKKDNKVDLDGEHVDIDPFTPQEVEAILNACQPYERNIVEFVFNTGLRPSEWSALEWGCVDFVNKRVEVKIAIVMHQKKGTKTKAGKRLVPLNESAINALKRQKELSFLQNGFIFPNNLRTAVQLPNGELNRINPDSFRKHK